MAAGDIYNALQRNQNLDPVANSIEKFFQAKQKQKDLEDFWNMVKQTKQGIQGATSPGANIPNPHFQNNEPGPWSPEISTTQFDPVKAGGLVSDFTMNALQKFTNMNPQYVDLATSLLEKGIKDQTPTYQTKEFDQTKGLEQITQLPGKAPTVKTIRTGTPKKNLTGLKENPKTGTYWGIDQDGNPADSTIPYDTTTKDIANKRLGLEQERVSIDRARLNKENPKEDQNIDKLLGDLRAEKMKASGFENMKGGYETKKEKIVEPIKANSNVQGIVQQITSTLSRRFNNFDSEYDYLRSKGMNEEQAIHTFLKENRKSRK